jgi:aspartyl-tRNA(Asn)/glutamyl-tRNA(Gln) amidotransferase subunit A
MAAMHELSASEAARRIRAGALSPSNLVAACLKRIDATEPTVAAWVRLDRDAAARVAVQRDIEAREGRFMGPLHGVPVALKDIFDAAGVPTMSGAPDWAARTPTVDATSVARLRAAGAVSMGKLTTTPFAFLDPCATRNPWNPEHTPGGSSSGPAAAVARAWCRWRWARRPWARCCGRRPTAAWWGSSPPTGASVPPAC